MSGRLATDSVFFHQHGLKCVDGAFFYEGSQTVAFYPNTLSPVMTSSLDVKIQIYDNLAQVIEEVVKLSAGTLEVCVSQLPMGLYTQLKSKQDLKLVETEGFDIRLEGFFQLWDEVVSLSESTFLYFLSLLNTQSYEKGFHPEDLSPSIQHYLAHRGSLETGATVLRHNYEGCDFVSLRFVFAKGGLRLPLSVSVATNVNDHEVKRKYKALTQKRELFENTGVDATEWISKLKAHVSECGFSPVSVKVFSLSTMTSQKKALEMGRFSDGGIYYMICEMGQGGDLVWSNVFKYDGGSLKPVYRTHEKLLEVEL